MITENLSTLKIHKLTQAQYDRELENGTLDETALYLTPDETVDMSAYATVEQVEAKADVSHTHVISDVTDLVEATESTAGLLSAADKTQLNYGGVPIVTASSDDGVTYTVTVDGMSTLTIGMTLIIVPSVVSTSTATKLNVNGLGDKLLRRRLTNATKTTSTGYNASWLSASKPVMVMYDGTYWIADVPKPAAADMSGTLGITNGGTGATTASGALENLGAMPTSGGTFTGSVQFDDTIVLNSNSYGEELPEAGTAGRLFFLISTE